MTRAQSILDSIARAIDDVGFAAHGLHVRAGAETASHRWTPETREEIHSLAKGVAVLAAGIARDEGVLDPDEPVTRILTDAPVGLGADAVTSRHLLTMTSGVDFPWSPTMFADHDDVAHAFLGRPRRGHMFQYANASTYVAMRALHARVGDVVEWLRPRLFEPLGIDGVVWERCPRGYVRGGDGIALTTSEIARIGRLIRDRGACGGRRIVAADWVDGMHADWIATGDGPGYDGYAMGGWRGPGGAWRLHGSGGQLLLFVDDDTVITLTGDDHFRADAVAARAVEAAG
ncbi:serine hydrolase domain-containing protein [Microbacterium halophytorum]|uniref:serine hydrolase domain-containing protein n=1 Tax=Microbacterium halophytorum TaxID=2067568 RepID=UPI000CFB0B0F|nr:serine hydrolase [Microbacterium halophytorum]